MKKFFGFSFIKNIREASVIMLCLLGLLLFPTQAGEGIKSGFKILYETLIPTLFPFMVLSSYVAMSPFTSRLSKKLNKTSSLLFKINGNAIITLILGFFGGYPVGAKTAAEFYETKRLTKDEVSRLLCFCVNPSLPFCVTAVGTFMLGNTKSGVLIYVCTLLSSITLGFLLRFTRKSEEAAILSSASAPNEYIFVDSVSRGNSATISLCGWVLVFACINGVVSATPLNASAKMLITCISEVTLGCKAAVSCDIPLYFICALLSFGGLAVVFQVGPYLKKCNIQIKDFLCWRIINGTLSGLFCFILTKIFPQSYSAAVTLTAGNTAFTLNHSLLAGGICILMCIVFIFEVDNRRKIC